MGSADRTHLTLLSDVTVISALELYSVVFFAAFFIHVNSVHLETAQFFEKKARLSTLLRSTWLPSCPLPFLAGSVAAGGWGDVADPGDRERIRVSILYLLACQSARLPIYHPFAQEQQMIFGIQCHC